MKRSACCLVLVLMAGCTHGPRAEDATGPGAKELATPPPFVNGPMSLLLTNADGFSARVTMRFNGTEVVSGELLVRGSILLFATDSHTTRKRSGAGGISYIWDVTTNSGFVLSEPLQGYAPISSNIRFTNCFLNASAEKPVADTFDGHRCVSEEAAVAASDGSVATFTISRALDLKSLPIRISLITNSNSFTISLANVRRPGPPAELFLPPDGFTRYGNAEVMMNELAARQHGSQRGATPAWSQPEDSTEGVGGRRNRGYGGGQ